MEVTTHVGEGIIVLHVNPNPIPEVRKITFLSEEN